MYEYIIGFGKGVGRFGFTIMGVAGVDGLRRVVC